MRMTPLVLAVLVSAGVGACANTPPPRDEVALARAAVAQAEQPAARHAPDQLLTAQRKLSLAEEAMRKEDYERARRLAEEAEVDARLAMAMSESSQAQESLKQVQDSIAALKQELVRSKP